MPSTKHLRISYSASTRCLALPGGDCLNLNPFVVATSHYLFIMLWLRWVILGWRWVLEVSRWIGYVRSVIDVVGQICKSNIGLMYKGTSDTQMVIQASKVTTCNIAVTWL